jgi:hypothetical protein
MLDSIHTHDMSVVQHNSHPPAEQGGAIEEPIPSSLLDLLASPNDSLDLESPAAKAYLDRLVSLGLDDLVQEPSIISNEGSGVDLELVNLCYREYSTFTSVYQCSAAIGAAFDDFDNSLDKLIESIPALEDECRQFGKGTAEIQSARKRAVLLQEHEDKLLDVLEIPQLMETCVRNGYYQEALELSSHVSTLREKHHAIIVDDVADEANGILQLMTAQLLGVLREPVKLPALIKAVGYLRKLQDLDDIQLGLAFLSSRLHNYRARFIEIEMDRAEPVRYLRRYIDLFREHVFDIISQYTTIFSGVTGDQLATFVNLCVDDLSQLVHRYIPRIASDSAAMSSILVQLGYCSLSFARAGLDFSALLVDPFITSITAAFDQAAESAATLVKTALALDPQPAPTSSLVSAHHLQHILTDPHSPPNIRHESDNHTPPALLAHFPPIAQFLNGHLSALNSLRLLAPFQSLPTLQASQNKSIESATAAVLDYVEQAVAIDMSGEVTRSSGSRHRHTRTNSTPRAHLIRRNTETQLSAETLAAKRRETKRICVAFADAWVLACDFLRQAMGIVLETESDQRKSNGEVTKQLEEWIEANREKDLDSQEVLKINGDTLMNSLEEGSEAVEEMDVDKTEPTVEPAVPIEDRAVTTASPEVVPVDMPPSTLGAAAPTELPSPILDETVSIEPPIEPPEDAPVEIITPAPTEYADRAESQGVDLPPVPVQVPNEPVAAETIANSLSIPAAISIPSDGDAPTTSIEPSLPVEIEPAAVIKETLPAKVEVEIITSEATLSLAPTIESETPVNEPTESETKLIDATEPMVEAQTSTTANAEPSPTHVDPPQTPIPMAEPAVESLDLESAHDTPVADPSIEVPETATPPEQEEGTEPGTGTVTPTAEPNGQEPNAPKTNKKKKKKKGKK